MKTKSLNISVSFLNSWKAKHGGSSKLRFMKSVCLLQSTDLNKIGRIEMGKFNCVRATPHEYL